jgi:hypothetical protein
LLFDGCGRFIRGGQIQIRHKHFRPGFAQTPGNGAANAASAGDKNSFAIQREITTHFSSHPNHTPELLEFSKTPKEHKARKAHIYRLTLQPFGTTSLTQK